MAVAHLEAGTQDWQQEEMRLAALFSTAVLDTAPEPIFDSISRLAAEYFHADMASISFADQSRIWFKSTFGSANVITVP